MFLISTVVLMQKKLGLYAKKSPLFWLSLAKAMKYCFV
ncbi:putative inner membrane peptidase domain protein [Vibrio parahaemolyticus AQ3810]|nr:putative inner membrane peptidase domain protein [Vibrio parahaemolyticus AQ3810]